MESAITLQPAFAMRRTTGNSVQLVQEDQVLASYETGGALQVSKLDLILPGTYTFQTFQAELEHHMLEFMEPKQVKQLSQITLDGMSRPTVIILHPCCPPTWEVTDASITTLRKGMHDGEIAFMNLHREPVLSCTHSEGSSFTEIKLTPMSDDKRLVSAALMTAMGLVYFHPLQDPTGPYKY